MAQSGADPCCHGDEIWARHGDPVAYRLVDVFAAEADGFSQWAYQPLDTLGVCSSTESLGWCKTR